MTKADNLLLSCWNVSCEQATRFSRDEKSFMTSKILILFIKCYPLCNFAILFPTALYNSFTRSHRHSFMRSTINNIETIFYSNISATNDSSDYYQLLKYSYIRTDHYNTEDYRLLNLLTRCPVINPSFSFPQMVTRTKKIFVGGLSAPTTLEDVKNYFEQFGPVSVHLTLINWAEVSVGVRSRGSSRGDKHSTRVGSYINDSRPHRAASCRVR